MNKNYAVFMTGSNEQHKTINKLKYNRPGRLLLLLFTITYLFSSAQPAITSFSPVSGPVGTTVTINGTNFNTTPASNIVFFGATMASVSAASATSLTVTVPVGATYQYISVTNLSSNLTAYSVQPFTVTLGCGSISFAPKVDFATATQPFGVAIGDVDGDSKSDLAVTNIVSNSVSVYRNTAVAGTISFAAKVDFTTGTNPYGDAISDIDGDGKPEILTVNAASNTVSVFRNTCTPGTISFAAKIDFSTGTLPYIVAVGDLDRDGKPDIAIPNNGVGINTVSVLRNTSSPGTISFAAKVDYGTGTYPRFATIGDIDGDGKPDLIVGNQTAATVSIFRNTSVSGAISFAAKVDFASGANTFGIAVIGDVDGDGKPDMVVANGGATTVSVYRNTSVAGTLSFAAKVDFATGATPYSVSLGDLDGDGLPDVLVSDLTGTALSAYRNTSTPGTVSLAAKVDYTTGSLPAIAAVGDLDGDGKPDLAVANETSNSVSTFLNQCVTLPLELVSFTGENQEGNVVLKWITGSETNNEYFVVERSEDGNDFEKLGKVKGSGSSTVAREYSYTDPYPFTEKTYYRLKQVDYDGNYTYSNVVTVTVDELNNLRINIYPNPASTFLNCELYSKEQGMVNIEVKDVFGNTVTEKQIKTAHGSNKQKLDIDFLVQGIYFLKINLSGQSANVEQTQIKFIKQ